MPGDHHPRWQHYDEHACDQKIDVAESFHRSVFGVDGASWARSTEFDVVDGFHIGRRTHDGSASLARIPPRKIAAKVKVAMSSINRRWAASSIESVPNSERVEDHVDTWVGEHLMTRKSVVLSMAYASPR